MYITKATFPMYNSPTIVLMPWGLVTYHCQLMFKNFMVYVGLFQKLLIYKCDNFRHNFGISQLLHVTLILSHSPCCDYLRLHAVKNSNMEPSLSRTTQPDDSCQVRWDPLPSSDKIEDCTEDLRLNGVPGSRGQTWVN